MKITAEPRSDQWNADDFVGTEGRTFTIKGVTAGKAEQKYDIELVGEDRVWRPPLTVLRLLMQAWGNESDEWLGRRVTLYRDPSVRFGSDPVGGIRVSHMSDLPGNKPFKIPLTSQRGRRTLITVEPLPDEATLTIETCTDVARLREAWKYATPADKKRIEARVAELQADTTGGEADA